MTHGYAESARRVACIDLDGTLYPRRPLHEQPDPLPGAYEAMCRLKAAGYRIVVFTSRLSPTWLASANYTASDQVDRIEAMLRRDGIPFDEVTAEKVPAEVYVDDRAIRFAPGDWPAITDWILFAGDAGRP
jgi:hypothetical protein